MPGFKSEGWARDRIAKLDVVRQNLVSVMAGVHGAALFVVFDQHITHLFSTRVVDSVFAAAGAKGSSGEMERPSVVLNRVSIGCRTVQIACGPIAVDCTGMFRSLLFRNFSGDVSVGRDACADLRDRLGVYNSSSADSERTGRLEITESRMRICRMLLLPPASMKAVKVRCTSSSGCRLTGAKHTSSLATVSAMQCWLPLKDSLAEEL